MAGWIEDWGLGRLDGVESGVQIPHEGDMRMGDMTWVCGWSEDVAYEGLIDLRVSE